MRALIITVLTSICMFVLFSVRPVRLAAPLGEYAADPARFPLGPGGMDLVKAEYEKAVDEIKLRIEIEDNWYHYKFLLVGGLAAFLLPMVWRERVLKRDLYKTIDSEMLCSIWGLACLIAIAIDIHLRNNTIVTQQLGLWVANYAEPAFLQTRDSMAHPNGFLPWEQFLRIQSAGLAGMHADDLYGFTFWPHLHFVTWVLFITYVNLFHYAFRSSERRKFMLAGFALVGASLAAFTWVAHSGPQYLEFKIVPGVNWWKGGIWYPVSYLSIWAVMMLVNLWEPRVLREITSWRTERIAS